MFTAHVGFHVVLIVIFGVCIPNASSPFEATSSVSACNWLFLSLSLALVFDFYLLPPFINEIKVTAANKGPQIGKADWRREKPNPLPSPLNAKTWLATKRLFFSSTFDSGEQTSTSSSLGFLSVSCCPTSNVNIQLPYCFRRRYLYLQQKNVTCKVDARNIAHVTNTNMIDLNQMCKMWS